jgi:site-specific DNA-methyltransferase (adenine-specific)
LNFPGSHVWAIGRPPSYVSKNGLVYSDDAILVLRDVPAQSIDMVLTDPPYGICYSASVDSSASHTGNRKVKTVSVLNDTPARASYLFAVLVHEAERILKPGGCLCCFAAGGGPSTMFAHWVQLLSRVLEFKQAVIWDKNRIGLGNHYRHCYELVLVAKKRGARCKWRGGHNTGNILRYSRPKYHIGQHPTPKPVELLGRLIALHSNPADVVLDPFCGQGSTLIAAQAVGRRFIGIEIEPIHVERACQLLDCGVVSCPLSLTARAEGIDALEFKNFSSERRRGRNQ